VQSPVSRKCEHVRSDAAVRTESEVAEHWSSGPRNRCASRDTDCAQRQTIWFGPAHARSEEIVAERCWPAAGIGATKHTAQQLPRRRPRFVRTVQARAVGATGSLIWLRSSATFAHASELAEHMRHTAETSSRGGGGAVAVHEEARAWSRVEDDATGYEKPPEPRWKTADMHQI